MSKLMSNMSNMPMSNALGVGNQNYDPFNRNPGSGSITSIGLGYVDNYINEDNWCSEYWITKRNWLDAKRLCTAYNANLLNVENVEKHSFILKQLTSQNQREN
uniref:C-type lectin domain-containing protein n=1 Tax=Glossina austeni TaxID=7395 RepID=A0A1A9UCY8_GLOAU